MEKQEKRLNSKGKVALFLMGMMFIITLFPMISALEFDNIKTYDAINKEVTITNSFLGIPTSEVAKAKLITPQINYVMPGENRKVAQFEIDLTVDSYEDAFKKLDLINNRDGETIDREVTYKYLTLIPYDVDISDYKEVCVEDTNGTNCYYEEVGTHKETRYREEWTPIEKLYLTKGKVTIGLFADVYANDNVEWIPTLFGVEIEEWATWTSSFNVGLMDYYPMGNKTEVVYGKYNMTSNNETAIEYNASDCLIGGCMQITPKTFGVINRSDDTDRMLNVTNFTMNFWVRAKNQAGSPVFFASDSGGNNYMSIATSKWTFQDRWTGSASSVIPAADGNWTMITYTRSDYPVNNGSIYVNGVIQRSGTPNLQIGNEKVMRFGWDSNNAALNGQFDELGLWNRTLSQSEITDLFNNAAGISWNAEGSTAMTITNTLANPVDNLNTTTKINWFASNHSVNFGNFTNMTLQIWSGTTQALVYSNYTVSGGASNYTNLSMKLAIGNYTWNYYACAENKTSKLVDRSGNSNTGTALNGVILNSTYAKFGNGGASFDGVDDYINVTNSFNINSSKDLSVSSWIKINIIPYGTTTGAYSVINFQHSASRGIGLDVINGTSSTLRIRVQSRNDTYAIGNVQTDIVNENTWYNALFVYNSINNNLSLYLDGVYVNSVIGATYPNLSTISKIGSNSVMGGNGKYMNGSIDEVRIFNRTLSQAEITTLYNSNTIADTTGLVAYYDMDNTTGSTCSYATSNRTLRISNPVFGICNATNTIPFINFSFRDESSLKSINASLVSSWTIFDAFGDSGDTQSYSFTSTAENNSYAFCGVANSGTLSVSPNLQYYSTGYPSKNYVPGYINITNITTNTTLYLLATADGVYQTVYVTTAAGAGIEGATIIATKSDGNVSDSKTTDSSGQAQLWLDADITYTLTTSKSGYPTDVRSVNPDADTPIYITLGTGFTFDTNLSYSYSEGISYSIEPTNTTLYNRTAYDFKFIISSSYWTISEFGFTLYNTTGAVGATNSTSNGGTATLNFNVLNNTKIRMVAYWVINGTTKEVSKDWNVMKSDDTDYSLLYLGRRIRTYLGSGMFGLQTGFSLNLVIFVIILFTTGIVSYKFGISNPIIVSIFATALVAFFEFGLGLLISDSWMPITGWAIIVIIGVAIKEALT